MGVYSKSLSRRLRKAESSPDQMDEEMLFQPAWERILDRLQKNYASLLSMEQADVAVAVSDGDYDILIGSSTLDMILDPLRMKELMQIDVERVFDTLQDAMKRRDKNMIEKMAMLVVAHVSVGENEQTIRNRLPEGSIPVFCVLLATSDGCEEIAANWIGVCRGTDYELKYCGIMPTKSETVLQ
jgi:hypothetical protein